MSLKQQILDKLEELKEYEDTTASTLVGKAELIVELENLANQLGE